MAQTDPNLLLASKVEPSLLANLNLLGLWHNLIPVTLGNIIGGAVFIRVAYWMVHFKGNKN